MSESPNKARHGDVFFATAFAFATKPRVLAALNVFINFRISSI